MRQAFEERAELLWSVESTNDQDATYIALLGEEIVAFAGAHFGRTGESYPGRCRHSPGPAQPRRLHQQLVRARWEAAVERGTPALTVGAGAMSRPILGRLGFSIVGWADCLLDNVS